MATTSDYDARRVSEVETQDPSALRGLAPTLPTASTRAADDDQNDVLFFQLPDADLSGEELSVTVIPQRPDEFTCSSCFLVQHRSRLRRSSSGLPICADCV
jgi:Domain of unknown function (DUF4193)